MIQKFNFKKDNLVIPVSLGYRRSIFERISRGLANEYINASSVQIVEWTIEEKKIQIERPFFAYPSIDMNYVVAIYSQIDLEYPSPNNAVIYNNDGSIHKILAIPFLLSSNISKKIVFNKDSNPPLEAAKFEGGLYFSHFDWFKKEGDLVNRISIIYDREWIEDRELFPETGEIGRLLSSGKL